MFQPSPLCLWLHLRCGKWQKYGLLCCMSNFSEAHNCIILMQGGVGWGGSFHILRFHSWLTKMGHSALCEPLHSSWVEQPALLCVCVAEFSILQIRCTIAFLIWLLYVPSTELENCLQRKKHTRIHQLLQHYSSITSVNNCSPVTSWKIRWNLGEMTSTRSCAAQNKWVKDTV